MVILLPSYPPSCVHHFNASEHCPRLFIADQLSYMISELFTFFFFLSNSLYLDMEVGWQPNFNKTDFFISRARILSAGNTSYSYQYYHYQ